MTSTATPESLLYRADSRSIRVIRIRTDAESDSGPEGADDDVVSDPAKADDGSGDWSDEGGATPSGPADTGDHTQ